MSRIDHTWEKSAPPKPDVYTTRRNESKYLTLRYWDGESWFEIAFNGSRGGEPFKWPKLSRSKRPSWAISGKDSLRLRNISAHLGEIQWGEPFKVFDEKEVMKFLIATGRILANWRDAYQSEMRQKGGAA